MIETIDFQDETYPAFQATGNAMRFATPFFQAVLGDAKHVVDVGCNRLEWCYPGAIPIDPAIDPASDALNFPFPLYDLDGIVNSHVLEHLTDWVGALDYWATRLKSGGVLCMYLPHRDQKYWHPANNRKHYHSFDADVILQYFVSRPDTWHNVFITDGHDLNHSFYVIAEKI